MTSAEVIQRLTETQNEIAEKEQLLTGSPGKKALLAANDEVAAVVVDEEEQRILEQLDRLRNRLLLLEGEHEGLLKSEAQKRIPEIEQALGKLTGCVSQGVRDLREILNRVLAYAAATHPHLTERGALLDEARYLQNRFNTPSPNITRAEQLSPEEVSQFLAKIELSLRFEPPPSRWWRESEKWRAEIDQAARRIELRHSKTSAQEVETNG